MTYATEKGSRCCFLCAIRRFRAVAFGVTAIVNGCAVFEPKVGVQDTPVVPGADPQFEAAIQEADRLRKELRQKSVDLDRFEFWSGLGMFRLGMAGLTIGVFDGSKDALLGVGVAGAGLVGLRAFIPMRERKRIYAGGQLAVSCSITALSFASPPAVVPNGEREILGSRTVAPAGRLLDRPLERLDAIARRAFAAMGNRGR